MHALFEGDNKNNLVDVFFIHVILFGRPFFNQIQEIQYHFLELRDDLLLFTMSYFVSFVVSSMWF